ncbi:MAG: hypothetical protein HPY57_06345 [Ignavibacteria bacterium]|nr:hypothetical protein [Ignavibacteria bacterium]
MKQYEAVIKVMEENGGYATLGHLYQEVLKIPDCKWGTKTPFASIRRIVQDERFFFKIKPGLWALKSYKNTLPDEIITTREKDEKSYNQFNHTYYQGLIVEIGNLKGFKTIVPAQDKNKDFLNKKLYQIQTLKKIYPFSYNNFVNIARTIDVIWFNDRKMPSSFFEIEFTTNMINSLHKFYELQDFNSKFIIISEKNRKREFEKRISTSSFSDLKERVYFWSFDDVAELHSKTIESFEINNRLNLTF